MKTIRQIADELGVSKDKVKYQVRKLPGDYRVKKGDVTYLTDEGISVLQRIFAGDVGKKVVDYPGNHLMQPQTLDAVFDFMRGQIGTAQDEIRALRMELSAERDKSNQLTVELLKTKDSFNEHLSGSNASELPDVDVDPPSRSEIIDVRPEWLAAMKKWKEYLRPQIENEIRSVRKKLTVKERLTGRLDD